MEVGLRLDSYASVSLAFSVGGKSCLRAGLRRDAPPELPELFDGARELVALLVALRYRSDVSRGEGRASHGDVLYVIA